MEELRRRRLEELKAIREQQAAHHHEEQEERLQLQQQIQMLEGVVKQRFTRDALERYGNIRAAHPDKAVQLIAILAQAIQSGQLGTIADDDLKEMLKQMSQRRETRITRR